MTTTAADPTEAILSDTALDEKYLCDYIINVATGCRHGCRFCYVPATPNIRTRGGMLAEHADVDDPQREWGDYVLYRDDIPNRLPGLLDRKRTWRETERGQGVVGVSFHTDCFMDPRAGDITASVIETLADHGRHCRVLTRNPMLAANYMETFEAAAPYVTIGSSIPTLDEAEAAAIEPGAPPIEARLRGLRRFADAGVPVYVSMSPTYPTLDSERAVRGILEEIATLDPNVVFHEPINPRGGNFAQTVAAAEAAGADALADALTEVQGPDAWLRYACTQFAWVQRAGRDLGLPIHLWPDRQLIERAEPSERSWLRRWRECGSPESFAGRDARDEAGPDPPPLFTWEQTLGRFVDGGDAV